MMGENKRGVGRKSQGKEKLSVRLCQDANEEKIVKFKISISENILKSLYILKEIGL